MDYFNDVETEIAHEVSNRKADIAAVRAQIARDWALNAGARAKMNRDLLHKMAVNAKIARRNLDRFMRHTQMKMARVAYLQNRRNNMNIRRNKRMIRIDKLNAHVRAHAALIKENAKRAAKDLEDAQAHWQHKINAFSAHEASANSKLGAQFAAQDK